MSCLQHLVSHRTLDEESLRAWAAAGASWDDRTDDGRSVLDLALGFHGVLALHHLHALLPLCSPQAWKQSGGEPGPLPDRVAALIVDY